MKKSILAFLMTSLLAITVTGCGIKTLNPEPVPLSQKTAPFGKKIALNETSVPSTFNLCGKEVTNFKESVRNGFKHIAGPEDGTIAITSSEEAVSTLRIDSLEANCLGDKFVEGAVVTFKFKFTWSFKDGSEFSQSTTIAGGSEDGPKDALKLAIENMYNFALSAYLSKLNLGSAN